jgi:hypothetical protein
MGKRYGRDSKKEKFRGRVLCITICPTLTHAFVWQTPSGTAKTKRTELRFGISKKKNLENHPL